MERASTLAVICRSTSSARSGMARQRIRASRRRKARQEWGDAASARRMAGLDAARPGRPPFVHGILFGGGANLLSTGPDYSPVVAECCAGRGRSDGVGSCRPETLALNALRNQGIGHLDAGSGLATACPPSPTTSISVPGHQACGWARAPLIKPRAGALMGRSGRHAQLEGRTLTTVLLGGGGSTRRDGVPA